MSRQYSDREDAEDVARVHRRKKTSHGDRHRVSVSERPASWDDAQLKSLTMNVKDLSPSDVLVALGMLEDGILPPAIVQRFRDAIQTLDNPPQ
jgi:hypothetical protein